MTLLNYIALIGKEKYPEVATFYNELHFVEKAAAGKNMQQSNSTNQKSSFISLATKLFSIGVCFAS